VAAVNDAAWLEEHRGEFVKTIGFVWGCGDDYCRCEEAQVQKIYRDKTDGRFIIRETIWSGEFHTDGEPGAWDELQAYRESLSPDRQAEIEWQELWQPSG
jgi:hypothetical protein